MNHGTFILLYMCFFVVGIIGWIMNLFDIVGMPLDVVTAELLLRVLGIFFFPLGAIMGWFV